MRREYALMQRKLLEHLAESGWTVFYENSDQAIVACDAIDNKTFRALREDSVLITEVLRKKIKELNAHLGLSDKEVNTLIEKLHAIGYEPTEKSEMIDIYRKGIAIDLYRGKEVLREKITLISKNHDENCYIAAEEVIHVGHKQIRNDIILYINGIPIVNIECKDPTNLSVSWRNAYYQIKRYEKDVPDLYKYLLIGVAADNAFNGIKYFPITPWLEQVNTEVWKMPNPDNLLESLIYMLSPPVFQNLLNDYIFFRKYEEKQSILLPRYMQYRAVEKMYQLVHKYVSGESDTNRGLIWHWQGSGKTFEMIYGATKTFWYETAKLNEDGYKQPTIIFLVDRLALAEQLYDNMSSLNHGIPVERLEGTDQLKEMIRHSDHLGRVGCFITLIQKFKRESFEDLERELKKLNDNGELSIKDRKNVVVFIDEGHRSQYGALAAQLKSIFQNAVMFAFTGTPIKKNDRNTYNEFGSTPLDKYFIEDSIRDKFTVRLVYQPRLVNCHLQDDNLENILHTDVDISDIDDIDDIDDIEDLPQETRQRIAQNLNKINSFLLNRQRIEMVGKDIASHFKANCDGKFKALLIAPNRYGCTLYKKELDKYLRTDDSEVLISSNKDKNTNNPAKQAINDFIDQNTDKSESDIIDHFKESEQPKILIVTSKLLTGFDAPVLQTIYLDKPLKGANLLQALARANRPLEEKEKAYGLIIDYVGVLSKFKEAMDEYEVEEITNVVSDVEQAKRDFIELLKKTLTIFDLSFNGENSIDPEEAYTRIMGNPQLLEKFEEMYRDLARLFELVASEESVLEYMKYYKFLTLVHNIHRKTLREKESKYDDAQFEKYLGKTLDAIHRSTDFSGKDSPIPTYGDLTSLVKGGSLNTQAITIVTGLKRHANDHEQETPVELLDQIRNLFARIEKENSAAEEIIKNGMPIVEELQKLEEDRKKYGFDSLQLTIYAKSKRGKDVFLLKPEAVKEVSQSIQEVLSNQENEIRRDWWKNPGTKKDILKLIRRAIRRPDMQKQDLDAATDYIFDGVKLWSNNQQED